LILVVIVIVVDVVVGRRNNNNKPPEQERDPVGDGNTNVPSPSPTPRPSSTAELSPTAISPTTVTTAPTSPPSSPSSIALTSATDVTCTASKSTLNLKTFPDGAFAYAVAAVGDARDAEFETVVMPANLLGTAPLEVDLCQVPAHTIWQ
jgi:hypothetical protein